MPLTQEEREIIHQDIEEQWDHHKNDPRVALVSSLLEGDAKQIFTDAMIGGAEIVADLRDRCNDKTFAKRIMEIADDQSVVMAMRRVMPSLTPDPLAIQAIVGVILLAEERMEPSEVPQP